jgi:aryl carrier-like protein
MEQIERVHKYVTNAEFLEVLIRLVDGQSFVSISKDFNLSPKQISKINKDFEAGRYSLDSIKSLIVQERLEEQELDIKQTNLSKTSTVETNTDLNDLKKGYNYHNYLNNYQFLKVLVYIQNGNSFVSISKKLKIVSRRQVSSISGKLEKNENLIQEVASFIKEEIPILESLGGRLRRKRKPRKVKYKSKISVRKDDISMKDDIEVSINLNRNPTELIKLQNTLNPFTSKIIEYRLQDISTNTISDYLDKDYNVKVRAIDIQKFISLLPANKIAYNIPKRNRGMFG